jgi:hypothetical protein
MLRVEKGKVGKGVQKSIDYRTMLNPDFSELLGSDSDLSLNKFYYKLFTESFCFLSWKLIHESAWIYMKINYISMAQICLSDHAYQSKSSGAFFYKYCEMIGIFEGRK